MAHFIYPQATSTTAFLLDSVIVSPTVDSAVPTNNKGMPVVNLAGEGLGPLDVNTGAAGATTLRVVLSTDSTISIEEDKNYGVVGANTIRTAAQIGNATGAAEFGTGADSAQTLRVTLSTRAEAAGTPVSVRLSDGTGFYNGATETTASAISGKLPATLGQKPMVDSLAVTIANDQSAVPASQSGVWNITNITGTVSLPTGAATETNLTGLRAQIPTALGQTTMSASLSVTMASDQGTIGTQDTATGTLGAAVGTKAIQIAAQSGGNLQYLAATAAGLLKVDGSGATQPISAVSLPLPAGAATETTLGNIYGRLVQDFGSSPTALRTASLIGNSNGTADFNNGATSAQTLRVTLASDSRQTGGFTSIQVISRDYSISSISGTYATLGSTLSAAANCVTFFETGGSPIIIGWGSVDKFVIPPGGAESPLLINIPAGTQLQIKTADGTTVNSGRFLMTVLS